MGLNLFKDVECDDLDVKSDATIRGLDVTSGNITTATVNAINATAITARTLTATSVDLVGVNITTATVNAVNATALTTRDITATNVNFKLGQLQRSFGVVTGKDDIAATGVAPVKITFPGPAKIAKFGFMSTGSDVVIATTFNAVLQTMDATTLGTFLADGDYTLGTGDATTVALDTATTVRGGRGVRFNVATVGKSGSVYWFVDYRLNST